MRSKIFYEGYQSYDSGKTNNPYEEGTDEYEEWQCGFDLAEDDAVVMEYRATRRSFQRGYVPNDSE
jgi:hypothetical protein